MNEVNKDPFVSYPSLRRGDWEVKISETDFSICVFMINHFTMESEVKFFVEPIEAMYWIEYMSEKH